MKLLLERLKIVPNDYKLYEQALTHTSFANEHGIDSYERLEYLGDAVLELLVSEYFFKNSDYEEGYMTKLRASYVCENALYEYANTLNIGQYIKVGRGEEESGGNYRKSVMADVFEALLGAIYLDQGIEEARRFLSENVFPLIEQYGSEFLQDYKSMLQELVQTDKRELEYELINEEGPSHNKMFTVVVKIDNIIYGKGIAHSKKEAEQVAAKNALDKQAKQ